MQTEKTLVMIGGGDVSRALAHVLKSFGLRTVEIEHSQVSEAFANRRPLAILVFDYDVRERTPDEPEDQGVITWRTLHPEAHPDIQFLRLGFGWPTEKQTHPDWMCLTGFKLADLLVRLR